MASWAMEQRRQGKRIGFVPTMGYFHEGHLALMARAGHEADQVVVSLFVNPSQFGENEDFATYPKDFERDARLAREQGVDVLFCPEAEEMYPAGSQTTVQVAGLTQGLCGASRPGHFDGVTTVVAKLFNLVLPHVALFGQKDFQQLTVLRRMVADLNFPIEIIGHPIVREQDGLAMSSRNSYLSERQRQQALCLSQALTRAQKSCRAGERSAAALAAQVQQWLVAEPEVVIDYIKIIDDRSLNGCDTIDEHTVLALAVKIGTTRLIDNCWLLGEE